VVAISQVYTNRERVAVMEVVGEIREGQTNPRGA